MTIIERIDHEIDLRRQQIEALEFDIKSLRTARDILAGRPAVKALPSPKPAVQFVAPPKPQPVAKPVESPPKAAVAPREKTPGEVNYEKALAEQKKATARNASEAHRLHEKGMKPNEIARSIGKSEATVYNYLKRPIEDITAALMGDPPPGRSALDQRVKQ